jgi:hypothetical protein
VEHPVAGKGWRAEPPDEEGLWWLYGEEEFGTMGGNYTGVFPPKIELHCVKVWRIGGDDGSLQGVCDGRFTDLRPFDREKRRPGFVGVWQKVKLPELPDIK